MRYLHYIVWDVKSLDKPEPIEDVLALYGHNVPEFEANKETVDHLIQFCQLLHFWADKAISIDEETIKLLKGDKENESDSDSE